MTKLWITSEKISDHYREIIKYLKKEYEISDENIIFIVTKNDINSRIGYAGQAKRHLPDIENYDMFLPAGDWAISRLIRPIQNEVIPLIQLVDLRKE